MKRLICSIILVASLFTSTTVLAIEQQQAMNWCWASSIQDVLAQGGRYYSQTEIAARLAMFKQYDREETCERPRHPSSIERINYLAKKGVK